VVGEEVGLEVYQEVDQEVGHDSPGPAEELHPKTGIEDEEFGNGFCLIVMVMALLLSRIVVLVDRDAVISQQG